MECIEDTEGVRAPPHVRDTERSKVLPRSGHTGIDLIYVHGTWSDGAAFSDENSEFFKVLSLGLGSNLKPYRFPWSSGNSVSARETASIAFAEYIRSHAAKTPDRLRVVLCHSHGGGVVMGAMARSETSLPIDAVLTIGTPYLHVNRFESVEGGIPAPFPLWLMLTLVASIGLALAYGIAQAAAGAMWSYFVVHPLQVLLILLLVYGGFAFVAVIRAMVRGSNLVRQQAEIVFPKDDALERLKGRCPLPKRELVPTLLIKVPGDEAHGALVFTQFLSWLVHQVYAMPIRHVRSLRRLVEEIYEDAEDFDVRPLEAFLSSIWFFGCIAPLAILELLLRGLLSLLVVPFAAILSIPFGREFMWCAGSIVLAVGDTPPGDWRIVYMPPLDKREFRDEHLDKFANADVDYVRDEFDELEADLSRQFEAATRGAPHSRAYSDPRVASVIVRWLRSRIPSLNQTGLTDVSAQASLR